MPKKGNIAFISQSATLAAALLDRAVSKNVGFSYIVSLGTKLDLGFSDLIDFLGVDPGTKAIILYLEHIQRGRKFMTAVRSFAQQQTYSCRQVRQIRYISTGGADAFRVSCRR